jgi:hypothetical protein
MLVVAVVPKMRLAVGGGEQQRGHLMCLCRYIHSFFVNLFLLASLLVRTPPPSCNKPVTPFRKSDPALKKCDSPLKKIRDHRPEKAERPYL